MNNNNEMDKTLLIKVSTFISQLNHFIGCTLSWLTALMACVMVIVVIGRALNIGNLALQESITYMHALVFMLCLGFTLKEKGHVRVDINYRKLNPLDKAWVDVIGSIVFLLPFALFLTLISWQFVKESWRIWEGSANPGGIQAVFLLKTLIPISGILLALQGVAECLRNTFTLLTGSVAALNEE